LKEGECKASVKEVLWFTGTIAQSEPKLMTRKNKIIISYHPVIIFGECEGERKLLLLALIKDVLRFKV
jgi:hypothetical protein